jgi:hypothetical protein
MRLLKPLFSLKFWRKVVLSFYLFISRGCHVQWRYIVSLLVRFLFALMNPSNFFAASENKLMILFLSYPLADRQFANWWVISMKSLMSLFWSQ